MPAGIQLFGDNNIIQIDSNFRSLEYRGRIKLNRRGPSDFLYGAFSSDPTITSNVVVALVCEDRLQFFRPFYVWGRGNLYGWQGPVGTTVAMYCSVFSTKTEDFWGYIFDVPLPKATTYGLEIFDDQGRQVFTSEKRYLDVNKNLAGTINVGPDLTFPLSPSGNYGIVANTESNYIEVVSEYTEGGILYYTIGDWVNWYSVRNDILYNRMVAQYYDIPASLMPWVPSWGGQNLYSGLVVNISGLT